MDIQVLSVVKADKTIRLDLGALKDISAKELDVASLTKDYLIAVINMTASTCYTIAGTRRIGGSDSEWKWTPIPKTCPNCRDSYEKCAADGRYSAIMSTACDANPFEIFVGFFLDPETVQGAAFDIHPDCQHPGGVIGITD